MRPLHLLRLLCWLLLVPALTLQAQSQPRVDGTLFTSGEQRRYLDYLREDFLLRNAEDGFDIEDSEIPEIPGDGTAGPAGPTEYRLDGILRRGDGRISIWLNNQLVTEDALPANARLIRDGATYAIQFNTPAGTQLLRPGQTLQVANGAVQERYQRPVAVPEAMETVASEVADTTTENAATSADTESGAVEEVTPAAIVAAPADESDPDAAIEQLPAALRSNADALDSMIQTLQSLRDQAVVDDDDE